MMRRYRGTSWVSTLWRFYEGQYLNLVWAMLLYIIKASPIWAWPIVTRNVINALSPITPDSSRKIMINVGVMLILILQNVPTHFWHVACLSKATRNMQFKLRSVFVARLHQLSISFHSNFTSGRLQSKILRDVDMLDGFSRGAMNVFMHGTISIVMAMGVTLYNKPVLALFFVVMTPVAVTLIRVFRRPMEQNNKEFRLEMEGTTAMVSDMMEMIPVTRAHGIEDVEAAKLGGQFQRLRNKALQLDRVNSIFGAFTWVTFQTFNLFCVAATAWLALKGAVSAGDVVMYLGYFGMLVGSVNGFIDFYPMLCLGRESVRSLREILECPDIEHNEGKKTVRNVNGAIELDRVEYRYAVDLEPAVRDISLTIKPGDCVAFVGESGSGKSTLMNLIIGFRRPTGGRILLDGADMETLDMRTYRRHLAVVSQNTVLFSGTIRDNITYGLGRVNERLLNDVLDMANVNQFVKELPRGLDTLIGEHGGKLSGGQRQRISIARALIRDPKVIVLDEATSALDVASEKLVQEALQRLISQRTTLIVAHRLSTIRNADRVIVMKQGRIVESGRHDELIALGGEFARMVSLQK